MASTAPANITVSGTKAPASTDAGAQHAYYMLHWAFVILPIAVGVDKFFNVLTNWQSYLAPVVVERLGMTAQAMMQTVGVIEVLAGAVVALWPRVGAYIVAIWLAAIIANLTMTNTQYWDIAARDLFLLLSALALGSLSGWHNRKKGAPAPQVS